MPPAHAPCTCERALPHLERRHEAHGLRGVGHLAEGLGGVGAAEEAERGGHARVAVHELGHVVHRLLQHQPAALVRRVPRRHERAKAPRVPRRPERLVQRAPSGAGLEGVGRQRFAHRAVPRHHQRVPQRVGPRERRQLARHHAEHCQGGGVAARKNDEQQLVGQARERAAAALGAPGPVTRHRSGLDRPGAAVAARVEAPPGVGGSGQLAEDHEAQRRGAESLAIVGGGDLESEILIIRRRRLLRTQERVQREAGQHVATLDA